MIAAKTKRVGELTQRVDHLKSRVCALFISAYASHDLQYFDELYL